METMKLKLPGHNDYFTQEAYKVLRTNLQFCGQDLHTIVITSCDENEGKSIVTLSIAKSFADLGKRVLVIDADMRKSVIAGRNTTAKQAKGLSEVLTGMVSVGEVIYQVEGTTMSVLFAGKYPPNPVELLGGKYFKMLLEKSKESFDYIFVDTPPLGSVIDAAVVAENCDGALMIAGGKNIRCSQAQEVVNQLEKSGCKILGVVRNSVKKNNHSYYYRKKY